MEDTIFITIFGLITAVIFLFLIMAINFKWLMLGFHIMFKRFSSKNNVGLYFIRSRGGNFGLPKIVDLNKDNEEFNISGKKVILPINREDFQNNGLFFGLPYKLANEEDVKTSIGLYYHKTDAEGTPMFHTDTEGNPVAPVLSPIRNSISVSGKMLKALVDEKAFSDALKDFLQKNQLIIILVAVNIIVAGIGAYIAYETFSNVLPTMEGLVRSAIGEINNKLDLIIEAVK